MCRFNCLKIPDFDLLWLAPTIKAIGFPYCFLVGPYLLDALTLFVPYPPPFVVAAETIFSFTSHTFICFGTTFAYL